MKYSHFNERLNEFYHRNIKYKEGGKFPFDYFEGENLFSGDWYSFKLFDGLERVLVMKDVFDLAILGSMKKLKIPIAFVPYQELDPLLQEMRIRAGYKKSWEWKERLSDGIKEYLNILGKTMLSNA